MASKPSAHSKRVGAHWQKRRPLTDRVRTAALPLDELDENGAPITDPILVEIQAVTASGRSTITAAERTTRLFRRGRLRLSLR